MYLTEKPDLVILDLTMPDMNGFEVLEKLQQIDPKVQVVIGSADVQDFTQPEVLTNGATAFITKPFTPEVVQPLIRSLLEGSV